MSKIYQIYGQDAHDMTQKLLEASDAARLVPPGGSVALKPNLVIAGTPESGSTTHAGVLSGCISYFRDHGVKDISVIEGSWVGDETMRAMRRAGYDKVCEAYGVPFYDLKKDRTRPVRTAVGQIDVCCRALDADFLIDLPVLKGHCQTAMTCALKNCKGCLPDREKRRFHTEGLMRPIAALASALKPDLTIADSICGDLDFEEGGNPVVMNRIACGTDSVLVDSYIAATMGYLPDDIKYITIADKIGVGSKDTEHANIIELNHDTTKAKSSASRRIQNLEKYVCERDACSACYANLIHALARLEDTGRLSKFKASTFAIGQGFREKTSENYIGIGTCTKNFKNYIPGCPAKTGDILKKIE